MSDHPETDRPETDPWKRFRTLTRARIGLGRSGDALPTTALLDFQLAHARARDAVHGAADFDQIAAALAPFPTIRVHSAAPDRATYLRRPDLGRRLDDASRTALTAGEWDIAFVIADGLSAAAVQAHAAPLVSSAGSARSSLRTAWAATTSPLAAKRSWFVSISSSLYR